MATIKSKLAAGLFTALTSAFSTAAQDSVTQPRFENPDVMAETTAYWLRELRWTKDAYGFEKNPEQRSELLLNNRGPAWTSGHDFIADDTIVAPSLAGTETENDHNSAIAELGAISALLYNTGASHILLQGTFNEEMGESLERMFEGYELEKFIGLYLPYNDQAYTSFMKLADVTTLEHVAKHEASHALDVNTSRHIFISESLHRDLDALPDDLSKTFPNDLRNNIYNLLLGSQGGTPNTTMLFLAQELNTKITNYPDIQIYFPNTIRAFEILDPDTINRHEFYDSLSDNSRIWFNFITDLEILVAGENVDGAAIRITPPENDQDGEERAWIIAHDQETGEDVQITLHGYFKKLLHGDMRAQDLAPEAFADVMAEAHDGCERTETCYYFPRLTAEVQGIARALDILAQEERQELGLDAIPAGPQ